MTKVVSVINLKGGVAKTTLTVALADAYAVRGKRVLVVDIDPQCDASIMLVGQDSWLKKLHLRGKTLAAFFINSRNVGDVNGYIVPDVSDIRMVQGISLLASDIALADVLANNKLVPRRLLYRLLSYVDEPFDLVLIDCPPNFSILAQNALAASHSYIIPAIPDYLSLTLAAARTMEYAERLNKTRENKPIKLAGIVLTKYQANNAVHKELTGARNDGNRPLWKYMLRDHIIPQTTDLTEAAQYVEHRRAYSEKYPQGLSVKFRALAEELWPKL
jgi:chromosome partitioning protein